MEGWGRENARELLEGVVSEPLLEAYLQLVDCGGCLDSEAEALLGGAEVVRALTQRGMAHHWNGLPPRLEPSTPDLALHGALAELEGRLLEDHRQVLAGHKRLGEIHQVRARAGGIIEDLLVEVVSDPMEIKRRSYGLINEARRDWMTLENLLNEIPLSEASSCPPPPSFDGMVRCRSIYELSFMEQPLTAKLVDACVEAGEEARLLPHVGMKMKLADETVAMLPLTPTGMEGALVLRSPVIVRALKQHFEMLWAKATPIGATEADELSESKQKVLEMLAAGLQDETIARRMNVSVNTVRRHITEIKGQLDVGTRFAMGAAALRRGWIK
ncbi:helix-turn-helix transcriptional regulator [Actinomadura barringtoniae]|uniref:Helix-turn-helix transcriptional regulator n=1 Tax=Actinomadura barringtoniae TaxID=1427535 RepID=A0A939P9Z9_9ACTN|nr:helix-turn-helix transcriptional regulator [Actinomadura barringtoniae]MBO2448685.1 helix-turn-helix transcriptional regulator [Actinomadura barringtoniae]